MKKNAEQVPHPIPYQGSKRWLARSILGYFPSDVSRLVEPFAGSVAVSLAAALYHKADNFWLNDINGPLMRLWDDIINRPSQLASAYEDLWQGQMGRERAYYDLVRHEFNESGRTDCFLYLLARCVKASVRYNPEGHFNQSPDNRRCGARPDTMRTRITGASALLRGRTIITTLDYKQVLAAVQPSDLVYMDPPYQGVTGTGDPRYVSAVFFDEFAGALAELNGRRCRYIVSYDGRTGDRAHGSPLPGSLGLIHLEVDAGASSQATLLGRSERTVESLYLSPALVSGLDGPIVAPSRGHQLALSSAGA